LLKSNNKQLQLKRLGYSNDPICGKEITDLYLTIEYFSRIEKVVFHVLMEK